MSIHDVDDIIIKTPVTVCRWTGSGYEDVETGNYTITIEDVDIISLKDEGTNNRFLIVKPHSSDNRILVLWRISSGYRGSSVIKAEQAVYVIGYTYSQYSGPGYLGSTALWFKVSLEV